VKVADRHDRRCAQVLAEMIHYDTAGLRQAGSTHARLTPETLAPKQVAWTALVESLDALAARTPSV